ncbi:MAG TPA: thioesterase family protein [Opitutales bacterium]|jgi:acyl-CoA thioester hydrolase|nr:thioesterase family protein [Opitutales bacterium]
MATIDYQQPPAGLFVYRTRAHFYEIDALWVLHHSRYLQFVERAQMALFDEMMGAKEFSPEKYPDVYVVVSRVEIDYLVPLRGVTPFMITLRGVKLREAALTVGFEFRSEDGATLHAQGERTVCKLGLQTNQPTGWSAEFRAKYEPWVAAGTALT